MPVSLRALVVALSLALLTWGLPGTAGGGEQTTAPVARIADADDPVDAAIDASIATHPHGTDLAVLGRADVFADNLAGTALVGSQGSLLLADGGPDAQLRDQVLWELWRVRPPSLAPCGDRVDVYVLGGDQAVSTDITDRLTLFGFCWQRLSGPTRVHTAAAIAEVVAARTGTNDVVIARADDWADAATGGAWAAAAGLPVLVTDRAGLSQPAADYLAAHTGGRAFLLGGEAALSPEVAQAVAATHAVTRVAGPTRAATAEAIVDQLWVGESGYAPSASRVLVNGYDEAGWVHAFTSAPWSAGRVAPQLYTHGDALDDATRAHLSSSCPYRVALAGPQAALSTAVAEAAFDAQCPTAAPQPLAMARFEVGEEGSEPLNRAAALGVELALADIADAGGPVGTDQSAAVIDEAADTATADTQAALDAGTQAFVGPLRTSSVTDLIPTIAGGGGVACSPSSNGLEPRGIDDDGRLVRLFPAPGHKVDVLTQAVAGHGSGDLVVITRDDQQELASGVSSAAAALGVTTVDTLVYDDQDQLAGLVGDLPADTARILLLSFDEGGLAIEALLARDMAPMDGVALTTLHEIETEDFGEDAIRLEGARSFSFHPAASRTFYQRVLADPDTPADTTYTAEAYDCAVLLALASLTSGVGPADPAFAQAVIDSSRDGIVCRTFAACAAVHAAGGDLDYQGVSGSADLDDDGERNPVVLDIVEVGPDGASRHLDRVETTA